MGWFDWLKEIPLSAVLKERVNTLERELIDEKAKNTSLNQQLIDKQSKLQQAEAELHEIKSKIEDAKNEDRQLKKPETEALIFLSKNEGATKSKVREHLNLTPTVFDYHWHRLTSTFHLIDSRTPGSVTYYYLTQVGRTFLIKNNLIQ